MGKRKLKVIIEVDDLAGCEIKSGRKTLKWEELESKEQIMVINCLANFYSLFYRNFKENENEHND